jgi:hypothetical protein
MSQTIQYDYNNQAFIIDGVYQDCGHPQAGELTMLGEVWDGCNCYGRKHAGELYDPEDLTPAQMKAMAEWVGREAS